MPCTYDDGGESDRQARLREERTTQVACEALKMIEDRDRLHHMSPDAQAWWADHKRSDTARQHREAEEVYQQRVREAMRELDRAVADGRGVQLARKALDAVLGERHRRE